MTDTLTTKEPFTGTNFSHRTHPELYEEHAGLFALSPRKIVAELARLTAERDAALNKATVLELEVHRLVAERPAESAELDRLAAENARLKHWHTIADERSAEIHRLTADRDRLKAEVARLCKAIAANIVTDMRSGESAKRFEREIGTVHEPEAARALIAALDSSVCSVLDPIAYRKSLQAIQAALRAAPPPCAECEARKHRNDRVNYETTDDGFRICRGYHEKNEPCEWEYYVPRSDHEPLTGRYYVAHGVEVCEKDSDGDDIVLAACGASIAGRSSTYTTLPRKSNMEMAQRIVDLLNRAAPPPSAARAVVNEQAEDEGLWFIAETITEDILQKALRRLHAAVEGAAPPPGTAPSR